MTSKTFVSGTVIDSAWLNDVDKHTYTNTDVYNTYANGITDDTAAINAAITAMALVTAQGGQLNLASGKQYRIAGKLLIPTGVRLNLNGSTLIGNGSGSGQVMIESAYVSGVSVITNVGTVAESHPVWRASVFNGEIHDTETAFYLFNWLQGCKIEGIRFSNVKKGWYANRSFYAAYRDNAASVGCGVVGTPFYHFNDQTNAVVVHHNSATVPYGMLFEGGATAVDISSANTFEGGSIGLKLKGDCLGLKVSANYFENMTGTALDLTEAGTVDWDVTANYFKDIPVVMDDTGSTQPIHGSFSESNKIAGTGGLMKVSSPNNFMDFEIPSDAQGLQVIPANWTIGKGTEVSMLSTADGVGINDQRQKALYSGVSLIPVRRGGDVGAPLAGYVHFTTQTAGTTQIIDTKIAWQPFALFAKFIFRAVDGLGNHDIYGDIYGDKFKRLDADAMVMTMTNNGGFVRISLTQTAPPFASVTGSIQIVG